MGIDILYLWLWSTLLGMKLRQLVLEWGHIYPIRWHWRNKTSLSVNILHVILKWGDWELSEKLGWLFVLQYQKKKESFWKQRVRRQCNWIFMIEKIRSKFLHHRFQLTPIYAIHHFYDSDFSVISKLIRIHSRSVNCRDS